MLGINDKNSIREQWLLRFNTSTIEEIPKSGYFFQGLVYLSIVHVETVTIKPVPKVEFHRLLMDDWLLINTMILTIATIFLITTGFVAFCPFEDVKILNFDRVNLLSPPSFDESTDSAKGWVRRLEEYFSATKIIDEQTKHMLFLDKLNPKTRSLVVKLSDFETNRPSNQTINYADVKSSLLEIFKKSSISSDTALSKFIDRNQYEGESLVTFYIKLHSLARKPIQTQRPQSSARWSAIASSTVSRTTR